MVRTVILALGLAVALQSAAADFAFTRQRLFPGFDGRLCKVQPMIASDGRGTVLLSFQKLLLAGSDVFYGQFVSKSVDGGRTWGEPVEQTALADTRDEAGHRVAHYATVYYSARNAKWFAIGNNERYADDRTPLRKVVDGRPMMEPYYVSVDPGTGAFTGYRPLDFPLPYVLCKPFGQIAELDDGDLLLGFYYRPKPDRGAKTACVTVRYRFDGDALKVVEAGTPVTRFDLARGVGEPSLARFGGRFYLTLRSDEVGLFATSEDGLRFSEPRPWSFDDGRLIGNRNTQQHWVVGPDALYLAYTREGANNDHVFRNRAPIFLAQFDPVRECLLRHTETPLVPELGARLGNFCVASSGAEQWLVTAEWMQPAGCAKYGSDNSFWLVKLAFPPPRNPAAKGGRLFLTFDDRNFDGWRKAMPLFRKYGAHATFFIHGDMDAAALATFRMLKDQGHSLGLHGLRHRRVVGALDKMGEEKYVAEELLPQIRKTKAAGLDIRNFGYPCSERDERTDALLLRHFDRLRTGEFWKLTRAGKIEDAKELFIPADKLPGQKLFWGASIGSCRPTVTGEVAKVVRRIAETGESALLYSHNIRTDGVHHDNDIQVPELEFILSLARELGVPVCGMDEIH